MLSDTAATMTSWSINNRALSRAAACLREEPGGLFQIWGLAARSHPLVLLDQDLFFLLLWSWLPVQHILCSVLRNKKRVVLNAESCKTWWSHDTPVCLHWPCICTFHMLLYNMLLVQKAAMMMFSSGFKWLLGTWSLKLVLTARC